MLVLQITIVFSVDQCNAYFLGIGVRKYNKNTVFMSQIKVMPSDRLTCATSFHFINFAKTDRLHNNVVSEFPKHN